MSLPLCVAFKVALTFEPTARKTGLRSRYASSDPQKWVGFPDEGLPLNADELTSNGSTWEITLWKLMYGCSLFFLCLRALRILSIFRSLGLMVIVTFRMMVDVNKWFVVFVIFAFSATMVLVGMGNPRSIVDKCEVEIGDSQTLNATLNGRRGTVYEAGEAGDFVYASCSTLWPFYRTLFQGFGEFFLEEMTNELSVIFLVLTFLILNVILLNLLIAMMSGTYAEVLSKGGFANDILALV